MKEQCQEYRYKGRVCVSADRNVLRLILPRGLFAGKQKVIALGLPDTPENREIARAKANIIESDIKLERFDYTLEKYKPKKSKKKKSSPPRLAKMSLSELYEKYITTKKSSVRPSTWFSCFCHFLRQIQKSPVGDQKLTEPKLTANSFYIWATTELPPESSKRLCSQINAAFNWAIDNGIAGDISTSPFDGFASKIRNAYKTTTRPQIDIDTFSAEERDLIIDAFAGTAYHNYVRFLFFTGCRPCEAIALRWPHVASDLSRVTFSEVVIRAQGGMRRCSGLKTQKRRTFLCNNQVRDILLDARALSSSEIIFPAPKGGIISVTNFQRPWKKVLDNLGIPYRKPYNTRHTFITLCLEYGLDAKDVAKLVGNSPEIIYRHYAGGGLVTVPEFPKSR